MVTVSWKSLVLGMVILAGVAILGLLIYMYFKWREKEELSRLRNAEPFDFEIATMHNQGKREYQQDNFFVSRIDSKSTLRNKGLFALVADGMGGLSEGGTVSRIAADVFEYSFAESKTVEPKSFLRAGIEQAEKDVDAFLEQACVRGGTTFVGVVIQGRALTFASVGDSYIFHIRNHTITRLNRLHNYAAMLDKMVQEGTVTREAAAKDPKRALLTAYIGMGEVGAIDEPAKPLTLLAGDFVLLCSDGVANALGDEALLRLICETPFEKLGETLEQEITRQDLPNQDNNTAVVIHCRETI